MSMTRTTTVALLAALVAPLAVHASTYAIDPTHTYVAFEVDHFATSTNRGRFDKKEGNVVFDAAAKSGKVDILIDTTSINTGVAPFNQHLSSADFFNVAKFPTARFVGDNFSFVGDKVAAISGTLTLLGQTRPVTLKALRFNCYQNAMLKREVCGGDFEATIQRTQWGMDWGMNFGFQDNVKLVVQVEAIKQ
jgi:polyisoprenoid-binding protein YceI